MIKQNEYDIQESRQAYRRYDLSVNYIHIDFVFSCYLRCPLKYIILATQNMEYFISVNNHALSPELIFTNFH